MDVRISPGLSLHPRYRCDVSSTVTLLGTIRVCSPGWDRNGSTRRSRGGTQPPASGAEMAPRPLITTAWRACASTTTARGIPPRSMFRCRAPLAASSTLTPPAPPWTTNTRPARSSTASARAAEPRGTMLSRRPLWASSTVTVSGVKLMKRPTKTRLDRVSTAMGPAGIGPVQRKLAGGAAHRDRAQHRPGPGVDHAYRPQHGDEHVTGRPVATHTQSTTDAAYGNDAQQTATCGVKHPCAEV
jgi:hypothetical protein